MAFIKRTQSENHDVVDDKERDVIRRVAGQRSTEELDEITKNHLLREVEWMHHQHRASGAGK
jgi:hypothetical protein